MPDAQLREQRVDGAELDAGPTAEVAQFRGPDVVLPVGLKQRKGGEPLDDLLLGLGSREALQQLLENQARGDDDIRTEEGFPEPLHFRAAGVDEQRIQVDVAGTRPSTLNIAVTDRSGTC